MIFKKNGSHQVLNQGTFEPKAKSITTRPLTQVKFHAGKLIVVHISCWYGLYRCSQCCHVYFLARTAQVRVINRKTHGAIFIHPKILKYSNGLITLYKR